MKLNLIRPLAFFDLETTGVNVAKDRIVEISIIKILPDNSEEKLTQRINPTIPIPLETSLIHGIYDEDVKDMPTFKEMALKISDFIKNCDLAGYNCIHFDIPLLAEELLRVEMDFDMSKRKVVDVMNIYHKMEPRNLSAAYRFYCKKELKDAHSAEADTMATFEILKAQIQHYENTAYTDRNNEVSYPVVNNMDELHEFSQHRKLADLSGHIGYNDKGQEIFNFGKHKGKTVEQVFQKDFSYYGWMKKADFPEYTKKVIDKIKLRILSNKLGTKE